METRQRTIDSSESINDEIEGFKEGIQELRQDEEKAISRVSELQAELGQAELELEEIEGEIYDIEKIIEHLEDKKEALGQSLFVT